MGHPFEVLMIVIYVKPPKLHLKALTYSNSQYRKQGQEAYLVTLLINRKPAFITL